MRPLAITRLPGPELEGGERTFVGRAPIDLERALEQHAAYRAALEGLGFEVRVLPALPGLPDAVFVEDPVLVLDGLVVWTRPGAASRRAEVDALRSEIGELGLLEDRETAWIEPPGELEGGDVLAIDDVLLVGQSTRTNHPGLKQLAHLTLQHGYRVKAAAVEGCLHLETACTWLGDDKLLVNPRWVDLSRAPAHEPIAVDPAEPFAANTIAAAGKVLLPASFPRTADRIAAHGFEVVTVDLSEFQKAEAGPTCLSVRVAR